jgi:hypothetical protein
LDIKQQGLYVQATGEGAGVTGTGTSVGNGQTSTPLKNPSGQFSPGGQGWHPLPSSTGGTTETVLALLVKEVPFWVKTTAEPSPRIIKERTATLNISPVYSSKY